MEIAMILLGAAAMALAALSLRRATQLQNALIAKNAELLVEQDRVTRWEHVAEGFERIAKENEKEFAEALRRCDRLSEALQQSEDTVVRLRQELEQERSRGVDARELRNILSYNGTDEGQEEIN
ncbi:MAG: hypothetical protein ACLTWR_08925 [Agathobaculum desmolans]|uniref:hypothetical protein n=1 Tax=Agathobaculum desmolans TaxID=39484 RepID=UPI0039927817